MREIKITDLQALGTPTGDETLLLVSGGDAKQKTMKSLFGDLYVGPNPVVYRLAVDQKFSVIGHGGASDYIFKVQSPTSGIRGVLIGNDAMAPDSTLHVIGNIQYGKQSVTSISSAADNYAATKIGSIVGSHEYIGSASLAAASLDTPGSEIAISQLCETTILGPGAAYSGNNLTLATGIAGLKKTIINRTTNSIKVTLTNNGGQNGSSAFTSFTIANGVCQMQFMFGQWYILSQFGVTTT